LTWILTGNFGRPGTMFLHSVFGQLAGSLPVSLSGVMVWSASSAY
jgi:hypothetical protein